MNKYFALFALGLVAISLVGCGQKEVTPAVPGTTTGEQPAPSAPADESAEVDAQLADEPEDVEVGAIV